MSKPRVLIDVTRPIPDWGLSEELSAAVPIAASGVEFKSTRDISAGMQKEILSAIDENTLKAASRLVTASRKGKHSKKLFKTGNRPRTSVLFKRAK